MGLGSPMMDLPKPGESLFGKKSKLVFDCKPKAKAEPQAKAPSKAAPAIAPGGLDSRQASLQSRGDVEKDVQAKLEREAEEKVRASLGDFEKQLRVRLEREADEKVRASLSDFERQLRVRLEREAENRINSARPDLEAK